MSLNDYMYKVLAKSDERSMCPPYLHIYFTRCAVLLPKMKKYCLQIENKS